MFISISDKVMKNKNFQLINDGQQYLIKKITCDHYLQETSISDGNLAQRTQSECS